MTTSIELAHGSCRAGDSQCDEGLALLQKAQQRSQVLWNAVENETDGLSTEPTLHPSDWDELDEVPTAQEHGLYQAYETKPSGSYPQPVPVLHGLATEVFAAHVGLGVFPGYSGRIRIGGDVNITAVGEKAVVLSYYMIGTDDHCIATADGQRLSKSDNSCGMVVHEGTSCSNVGAPIHRPDAHDLDPLQDSFYASNGRLGDSVYAENSTTVLTLSLGDIIGRTFVVHSHSGDRVACGVINALPSTKSTAVAAGLSFAVLLATSAMLSAINM